MRRFIVVAAAMIVLPASAARADTTPALSRTTNAANAVAIPAVDASCRPDRSAHALGRFVRTDGDTVTVAVDDGSGTARAFIGASMLLPVAPNAVFSGATGLDAIRAGDRINVLIVACPDATGSAFSLVAGRLDREIPAKKLKKR